MQQRPLSLGNHEPEKAPFSFLSGGSFLRIPHSPFVRAFLKAAPLAALLSLVPAPHVLAKDCSIYIYDDGTSVFSKDDGSFTMDYDLDSSAIPDKGECRSLNLSDPSYRLSTLPENIFNGFNNLRSLSITFTAIQNLPEKVFNGLNNLKELILYYNELTTLPPGIFSNLNRLQTLGLIGNDLICMPSLPSSLIALAYHYDDPYNPTNSLNDHGLPPCDGTGGENPTNINNPP